MHVNHAKNRLFERNQNSKLMRSEFFYGFVVRGIITMVVIWPFLKLFARNKMVCSFSGLLNTEENISSKACFGMR